MSDVTHELDRYKKHEMIGINLAFDPFLTEKNLSKINKKEFLEYLSNYRIYARYLEDDVSFFRRAYESEKQNQKTLKLLVGVILTAACAILILQ